MSVSLSLDLPVNKDLLPIRINLSEQQQTELFSSWTKFVSDLYITEEYATSLHKTQSPCSNENDWKHNSDDSDYDDDREDEGLELYGCSCSSSPCCDLTKPASSENDDDCQCIGRFFISFDDSNPTPILSLPHPAHLPLVECGSLCHPSSDEALLCMNRISKIPIFPFLELRSSPVSSFGIFATHPIPAGAFISTYAGELITASAARSRWLARSHRTRATVGICSDRTDEGGRNEMTCKDEEMNYIFCLRLGVRDVYIDAGSIGGISRFFNHSHSPNIIPLPIFQPPSPGYDLKSSPHSLRQSGLLPMASISTSVTETSTDPTRMMMQAMATPRIGFFAHRRIDVGEELCWDYGDGASLSSCSSISVISLAADTAERSSSTNKRKSETRTVIRREQTDRDIKRRLPCFCQSENCDGYLPFDDNL